MGQTRIILLQGKAGSGKSTLMEAMKLVCTQAFQGINNCWSVDHVRFATPVYEMHDAVLEVLKYYGIERGPKDRDLLQLIGTEYGRQKIDADIWVKCAMNQVKAIQEESKLSNLFIIFDDLRFKNEFYAFKGMPGTTLVRLVASEEVRRKRADKFPDNPNHQSEIDLDDIPDDQFDLVIHTDGPDENKEQHIHNSARDVLRWAVRKV